jgi:hypothetical protein
MVLMDPRSCRLDLRPSLWHTIKYNYFVKMLHIFGKAKLCYCGLVLCSSRFFILPQLPQKTTHASKVIQIDKKIINLIQIQNTLRKYITIIRHFLARISMINPFKLWRIRNSRSVKLFQEQTLVKHRNPWLNTYIVFYIV